MGLLSRGARAIGRAAFGRARPGVGKSLIREAQDAAESTDAWATYLMLTGALGGLGGGLAGAYGEQEAGGNPNEGFAEGGKMGAAMGPLTLGPALGLTMMGGPVGAAPLVPGALMVQSASQRKRLEREERARQEEAMMRAIQMQLMTNHQR